MPEIEFHVGDCYDFYEFLTGFPYESGNEASGSQLAINVGISEETNRTVIDLVINQSKVYWRFEPVNFKIKLNYLLIVQDDRFMPIVALPEELDEYEVTIDQRGCIDSDKSALRIPLGDRRGGPHMTLYPAANDEVVTDRMLFPMVCIEKDDI